ncbi:hypothetical protein M0R19_03570 [Candidatus Pacearchaeota archaeon]|nr:hypothetical protein [Candidatus Pacearchaeota archaeon]
MEMIDSPQFVITYAKEMNKLFIIHFRVDNYSDSLVKVSIPIDEDISSLFIHFVFPSPNEEDPNEKTMQVFDLSDKINGISFEVRDKNNLNSLRWEMRNQFIFGHKETVLIIHSPNEYDRSYSFDPDNCFN